MKSVVLIPKLSLSFSFDPVLSVAIIHRYFLFQFFVLPITFEGQTLQFQMMACLLELHALILD